MEAAAVPSSLSVVVAAVVVRKTAEGQTVDTVGVS